jgi:hypothetical protein
MWNSLAGQSPLLAGLLAKRSPLEQKVHDRGARLMISRELGHEREQITAVYLGR